MFTRQQVMSFLSFAIELPVDTMFEVAPPETSGDILVTATSESWNGRQIAKLSPQGGREAIVNEMRKPAARDYETDRKS